MSAARPRLVGLPWYRPEDYGRIRDIMQDGAKLPESYGYWLSSAESVETAVATSGVAVLRVEIAPAEFLAWCERNGLPPDGTARSRYATEQAAAAAAG